ncbi:MAG: tetratricopeptide repeat protein [Bacteroidaceae bacterium]|nr:tetratricopeptide repeat protein [Bacteroidaceae bacterium]
MKRISLFLVLCSLFAATATAQNYRDYIRRGNRQYRDSVYDKAQVQYQKGFEKDSSSVQINYNLANSLLLQGQPKEAMRLYEKALKQDNNPVRLHQIYHNMGVILQSQKQFLQAIQAYVMALRLDPSDQESRYNLVVCQYQLKNNPQGGGGNGEGEDKQDKDQQKQQQQQQQQKKDDKQQKQQQQENQMSKENAEQMLNAAMQNERQTQDKVKKQLQQAQPRRLQKQW